MNRKTFFSALLVAALLSSTAFGARAQPILVNSESGTPRSIEGAWAFPDCDPDDPPGPGDSDSQEYLIFRGDTVEGRELEYPSNDGTCSGYALVADFETAGASAAGEQATLGWDENIIPDRRDGNGSLNPAPVATVLEFQLADGDTEPGLYYMDDSAEPWCLYRDSGPDGEPSDLMSADEPLCKVDIDIPPLPGCDIQLNQVSFVDGDTIAADVFRVTNPSSEPIAVEVKMWLIATTTPPTPPIRVLNQGANGRYVLPANADNDLAPLPLLAVTAELPRGGYDFSCRMLDPDTGSLLAEDRNFFELR